MSKHKKGKIEGTEDQIRIVADLNTKCSGLFEELVTSIRKYTTAFVTLPDNPTESPKPCGTATLVRINEGHYFLTASHVWGKLTKFKRIGITLVPDINHCFEIPTKYLIATGPRKPITRDEGPDIVLLKIPDAKLGEIKARCSFYSLKPVVPKLALKTPCIEIGILLGAPGEAAKSTANSNLDVTIQGVNADPAPKIFTKGPYDYLDSKEIAGNFGFPKSYRGFSGGGLWRLHVYYDPDTRERKFRARLDGMAFHESSLKGGHRFIRCHGRRSIDAVKRMVLTKKTEQHD